MSTALPVFATDSEAARAAELRSIVAATREVLASVAEQNQETLGMLEEVASDLADLQAQNGMLRRALDESTECCRQLREMAEMALALAASKGNRSAGRLLATFKAACLAATQEARS